MAGSLAVGGPIEVGYEIGPRSLRASTLDVAEGHLKKHLEPDWKEIPVEHITIDA
jgi:hypothetical protein